MNLDTTIKFLNAWGDKPSLDRLRASNKSADVQKSDCQNHLKGMAMRFERAPNETTLRLWASDMIDAGYSESQVSQVCKSAPYKFERHPTLAQLMELLRPYKAKEDVLTDELNDLTHRCFKSLKSKLEGAVGVEAFAKMVDYYVDKENSVPGLFKDELTSPCNLRNFNRYYCEMAVLGDWLRSDFGNGQKIMEQREKTVIAANKRDREYFIVPYKRYATANNL